jgi:GDP-mannose 6-dehydrogenase
MKIAIFGLGYVGSVSAACFASAGHDVIGVDVDLHKLELIRSGRSPVTEPGLDDLLAAAVGSGRLSVTDDAASAVLGADISLVCVGTPGRRNGSLGTDFLERVMEQIGMALARRDSYHLIAVRSTILPGVLETRLLPLLEAASGRTAGSDFGVCVNPEFLREGSAIADFDSPPFTVVGEMDSRAGDVLLRAYDRVRAPVYRLKPDEASMLKYASNAFHALKVAFANEVGAVSRELGVDGREVMRAFCEDRNLNISPAYLRPGFAFGGSCLPKDVRALGYAARELDVATPLLSSVIASNDAHVQRVVDAVLDTGKRRVALIGLSFKRGSDDLRESPLVTLAEALIGRGMTLRVWDPDVSLGQIFGRNRAYIEERIPHVAQLLVENIEAAVRDVDTVIVGKQLEGIDSLPQRLSQAQLVIDLVGVSAFASAVRPWAGKAGGRRESVGAAPARS